MQSGMRIDSFAAEKFSLTRSAAAKLIENGHILVNGKSVTKNYKLKETDIVTAEIPEPEETEITPENIPLNIVYEDDDIIIVNKPQGMVVHPAAGNYTGTLVNALMFHAKDRLSGINGVIRPGIVHRIDKDTSGILAVAKNNEAHLYLANLIKEHNIKREYVCLVLGNVKEDKFTVDKPIARHPKDRKKMAVVLGGKKAVTHFEVLQRLNGATLLKCTLETGRTHQIRVHLNSVNLHIAGDPVYGVKNDVLAKKYKLCGQLLHAKTLGFVHPKTKEYVEFTSDLPEKFCEVVNGLKVNE